MPVWQKAMALAEQIFKLTSTLPRCEDYGLTSQIRRSSSGIPGNISEEFGRSTKKDKRYFYIVARGSSFETQSHLIYSQRVGYFEKEIVNTLFEEYNILIHEINKIIKTLS